MNFKWDDKTVEYTIKIKDVDDVYPHWGFCNNDDKLIKISDGLHPAMFRFVLFYNLMHLGFDFKNSTKFETVIEESSAFLSTSISHPIGCIITIWCTLTSWDRVKQYIKRFMKR